MHRQLDKKGFRFSLKDALLTVLATGLALASLKADDPWVVVPMLLMAGIVSVLMCIFHEGNRFLRAVVAIFFLGILIFIGWRALRGATEVQTKLPMVADPHIHIERVNLQLMGKLGFPIKFLVYMKSDGADGAVEAKYSVTTADHVLKIENRDEFETGIFANLRLTQSLYPTAIEIHHNENISFFIQADKTDKAQQRKMLSDFNGGGPLYLMAVFRYVGRPDLKPVETCEYWTRACSH